MISLGCAKNRVDSEILLGSLQQRGYEIVSRLDQAETVIVNTCGFIDEAREESIDTILELAAEKASAGGAVVKRLLVAGCMVNRYGEELAREIPEIDGFIGLDDLEKAPELVQLGRSLAPARSASYRVFDHRAPRLLTTSGHAYLKVAEGCNNPCTFCAIPVWRGRFRSRSVASLVDEARSLEAQGVLELCLIAQDTTRYGEDLSLGKHGLLRLIEALLEGTGIPWIRFLYAYPTTLDDELLKLMGTEERFASYLDMPLQHSHPEMLRAMRRGGNAERYSRLLERARELVPEIALRTTFIAGFPGETEEHFAHLADFIERSRFDHLGVFNYSQEADTPSASLADQVSREVASSRRERLLEIQRPIAQAQRERLIGRTIPVLVRGVCSESEHLLEGRHQGLAPGIDGRVLINDGYAQANSFADVEITDAFADDVVGRVVTDAVNALGGVETPDEASAAGPGRGRGPVVAVMADDGEGTRRPPDRTGV